MKNSEKMSVIIPVVVTVIELLILIIDSLSLFLLPELIIDLFIGIQYFALIIYCIGYNIHLYKKNKDKDKSNNNIYFIKIGIIILTYLVCGSLYYGVIEVKEQDNYKEKILTEVIDNSNEYLNKKYNKDFGEVKDIFVNKEQDNYQFDPWFIGRNNFDYFFIYNDVTVKCSYYCEDNYQAGLINEDFLEFFNSNVPDGYSYSFDGIDENNNILTKYSVYLFDKKNTLTKIDKDFKIVKLSKSDIGELQNTLSVAYIRDYYDGNMSLYIHDNAIPLLQVYTDYNNKNEFKNEFKDLITNSKDLGMEFLLLGTDYGKDIDSLSTYKYDRFYIRDGKIS